jgi:hypothetical protein
MLQVCCAPATSSSSAASPVFPARLIGSVSSGGAYLSNESRKGVDQVRAGASNVDQTGSTPVWPPSGSPSDTGVLGSTGAPRAEIETWGAGGV